MVPMHIFSWHNIKSQSLVLLGFFGVLFIVFTASVAAAIARGYTSEDAGLQVGMVAALSAEGAEDEVERATQETSAKVIGIISTIDGSPVSVSVGAAKVLVESEGQVDAYVSDLNGVVKKGDLLVLSPLKGILMKAKENTTLKIIGIAAENPFTSTSYDYVDQESIQQTQIAKIKIDLNYLGSSNGNQQDDSALSRLGEMVVGRRVSEIRVLIALLVFIVVLVAEGGILYGAISSGITALGRNPLAKHIIRGELVRVVLVAIAVLVLGLVAVYIILKV